MVLGTFQGGVHPVEGKDRTEHLEVQSLPLPRRVIIPLHQHTGAPATALVEPGQEVKAGQKIGEAPSAVSAGVHASIGGTVTAVAPHAHPAQPGPVLSVTIERSEEAAEAEEEGWDRPADWRAWQPAEILRRIREAGVVGLGGAAFPTHVKLAPPGGKTIDTLIVNGVECEPCLTSDHRLMLERPEQILEGIRMELAVLGLKRAFIGIERNKPDAIHLLTELCGRQNGANGETTITVVPLKVKYPQGAEKQLIRAILGREVPSGGLPFDVGAIVQNVGTVHAVYEAVALGKPLIERVVTVGGDGVREPKNLRVRIGTLFSEVIEACGGFTIDGPVKLLMGGPMMGLAQYTADVPVIKGTSGILVLRHEAADSRETACIRCGRCVEICPMSLTPNRLADYAGKDDFETCLKYGVKDCIECGACTWVCGSRRPIVHLIKYTKMNLARRK